MLPVLLLIVSQTICGQVRGGEIKREKIVTHKKKHNKKNNGSNNKNMYTKSGSYLGYDYVDLGLSVKWGFCNVGANSPEQYGSYYAWGELNPKSKYTKQNSETYGVKMNDISGNPQYDVAKYKYGGTWRIPTKYEFNELIERCKWQKTKYKNVIGYKVTGPNGKSIFFPLGGEMLDNKINESIKYEGNYWTSTPYTRDTPDSAPDYDDTSYYVFMNTNGPMMFWGNHMYCRGLGLNIRPICN